MNIEVYDPPMCCSSGVCGSDPDEQLVGFAADLNWLAEQGATVRRYNLSQEPAAFVGNAQVHRALNEEGEDCLPMVLVDGKLVSKASYPSREELAQAAGVAAGSLEGEKSDSIFDERVAELVALGAAIASNCESCFEYHFKAASGLGISRDDMIKATNMALQVKEQPNMMVVRRAQGLLTPEAAKGGGGCCGGSGGGCC